MKSVKLLFYALFLSRAASAFAADPVLKFDLNSDSLSYSLIIENPIDESISCESIVVQSQIGNKECSQIISTYIFRVNNKVILGKSSIVNSTFGLDFSHQQNLNHKNRVFCGQPSYTLNCK